MGEIIVEGKFCRGTLQGKDIGIDVGNRGNPQSLGLPKWESDRDTYK